MGSGFSKMKKQRKQLEEQFAKMQKEMQESEYRGKSGSGLVEVVLTGDKSLKAILIKPECVDPNDVEGLQDLIVAAFKEAEKSLEESSPMSEINPIGLL
ncbi:MAG: YbaB/EbfC family nucleoid-associated protein [Chlamydiae bacterium]|jgi:DNA-binding YbaB/EbfC family protein|nr:YbaB/EbfC family nucleoid-associated protein [Chlamydiota bacterium]